MQVYFDDLKQKRWVEITSEIEPPHSGKIKWIECQLTQEQITFNPGT
ncbi:hypothetical protein [Carboxylicivirga sp. M1479]|nr:hypothetical protein [Carboxylicivirga sp. M1479]